jgi:predicted transcriptional regulator
MSVLTLRIPDEKHERLRRLAESRGLSMNRLVDELATVALAQFDAQTRFQALAARGSATRGIELLDRADAVPRPARRRRATKGR